MLKLLLKKQAQEWASFLYLSAAGGRRRSRAAIIGYAALLLYAAAAFGAMFWLLNLFQQKFAIHQNCMQRIAEVVRRHA